MYFTVKNGCGQSTDQMISYFQSPNWPEASKDRIICTLTVELQPDVMQVRVDFLTMEVLIDVHNAPFYEQSKSCTNQLYFQLKAPIDGACDDDQFVISGQNPNSPMPVLCGINNDQHG